MSVGFQTIEGVEIAHVGMEWPAMSGPVTITMQHLADAVTAAMEDPHVLIPRLKIGHDDPRFNEDPAVFDPFAYAGYVRDDGNPVYGRVDNLRLTEDGMVLVGDYIDVPDWLANALPSAYPNRSLEATWNVKTDGGKRYSFVITSVALLGEPLPAISCLEDLVRELSGGPDAVLEQTPVHLARREPMPVQAEASTDSVYQQFLDDFAQGDRWFWWPCEIRVDQAYILADDEEGHMYRVPVTVDADGVATFGDPVRGVLDFREVPEVPDDGEKEPVAAARVVRLARAIAARPKDRVRAANDPEGGDMANGDEPTSVSTTLLERLGLAADATQEQIDEAMLAKLAELDEQPDDDDDKDSAAAEPEAAPVAASAGGVTVDPETWKQMQNDVKAGREAREQQVKTAREQFVDAAIKAGKFPPARRDHYLALMERDEHGTREFVNGLAAGSIPVDERAQTPDDKTQLSQGLPLSWFPELAGTAKEA